MAGLQQTDPIVPSDVSRETSERFALFKALLQRWNKRINLVADETLADLDRRHVADSLEVAALLPLSGTIVDLGSGAGLPGLIVALATGRPVTLVEADIRKASFLREAARETGAPVTIVNRRIEACGLRAIDIVLARALAPLPRLLGLVEPVIATEGVALLHKGARVDVELTEAQTRWQMTTVRHPSRTTPQGCVLEVRHLRRRASFV